VLTYNKYRVRLPFMKILKDKFLVEIQQKKQQATDKLTSGSTENMQEYGKYCGMLYGYAVLEESFMELWAKYVLNGEGEED